MIAKFVVIVCFFGLTRAGEIYNSALNYGSLGGYGYGGYAGYAGYGGHGSSLGLASSAIAPAYSGYSSPALSYSAPAVSYAGPAQAVSHVSQVPVIDSSPIANGYGSSLGYGSYAPSDYGGYGSSGLYGARVLGYGGYGSKYAW